MISSQKFSLAAAPSAGPGTIAVAELLGGEVSGVRTELVSISGPLTEQWAGDDCSYVALISLEGAGRVGVGPESFTIDSQSIIRVPFAKACELEVPEAKQLWLLKVTKTLDQADKAEIAGDVESHRGLYARRLVDCPAYQEDIKSEQTVNRMLLDEGLVPRFCMGSVETTGPDRIDSHVHEMLDQLFLGLAGCRCTCHADGEAALLTANCLLHVPLGSDHSVSVAEGDKLHYIWMDFFLTLEGQAYMSRQHRVEDAGESQETE